MLPAEQHLSAIAEFLDDRRQDLVRLRLVTADDASFILSLRLDPIRNQNISTISFDLDEQLAWMQAYARRCQAGQEAYFIVEEANEPQGTVRLYDYKQLHDSFCWGSWVLKPGRPSATAYKSAILVYDLGFKALGFSRAHFNVRQTNVSVWKFHEKMGARLEREDSLERIYRYELENYLPARARLARFTQNRSFS
jgi:RimJ/RimL family protein N-acetyltransferase